MFRNNQPNSRKKNKWKNNFKNGKEGRFLLSWRSQLRSVEAKAWIILNQSSTSANKTLTVPVLRIFQRNYESQIDA